MKDKERLRKCHWLEDYTDMTTKCEVEFCNGSWNRKGLQCKYVNKVCSLVIKTKQFLDSTILFSSDSIFLGNLYLHLKLSRGPVITELGIDVLGNHSPWLPPGSEELWGIPMPQITSTFKTPKLPPHGSSSSYSNNHKKWINSQSPLKNFSAQGLKRIGGCASCSYPASLPLKELLFQYNFNLMTAYQSIMVMTSCFIRI